jgi:hypothetical protein
MSFQYCIRIIEFTASLNSLDFYMLTGRFLGLQGPDPLFKNNKENLDFYCSLTSL